ncbi:MAG: hypothetical protein Q4D79_08030 [Propionibacteriaceae bacterium]|nr:hypothetical protein [Propionibacteriaceae bacterium]
MAPETHGVTPQNGEAGEVVLYAYQADGSLLDYAAFRKRQSNGASGDTGHNDALLHADSLAVADMWPLEEAEGATARLTLPEGGPFTLSLAWPTSHGYSALMADLNGPGSYDLHEVAARTLHNRQQERIQAGPQPDAAIVAARSKTEAELARCNSLEIGPEKGTSAVQCLELAAEAQLMLDRALTANTPASAFIAVTFTRVPNAAEVTALSAITGGKRTPAVRLVVSDLGQVDDWARTIDAIHAIGGQAVVQVCDSYQLPDLSAAQYEERLNTLLTTLSAADAWEVGNELAGNWLGEDPVGRTALAARRVREMGKPTLLTLYYQLGEDDAEHSMFTWSQASLKPDLMDLIDVVGLSIYPQDHPLGTAAERVMTTLERTFPGKRVAITELGYQADDLAGLWWFGSATDANLARRVVAEHLTSVGLGRAQSWGAPFWWYYLEDQAGDKDGIVSDMLAAVAAEGA